MKVAEYRYNEAGEVMRVRAWSLSNGRELVGEIPKSHIAVRNPWRWKGYYWDGESGLYCVTSGEGTRYYDPKVGRFISPASWEAMLANAHESAYVAWGNSFVGAPSNQESYHCYLPVVGEIGKAVRGNWFSNWWGGLSTGQRFGIGALVLGGSILLAVATGGMSLKFKGMAGVAKGSLIVAGSSTIGGLTQGSISALGAAPGERGGAFAGGFVDGSFSTLGLALGLASANPIAGLLWAGGLGFTGGFLGSAIEQRINSGEVCFERGVFAGGVSAVTNMVVFAGMRQAGIFMDFGAPSTFGSRFLQASRPSVGGAFMGGFIDFFFARLGWSGA